MKKIITLFLLGCYSILGSQTLTVSFFAQKESPLYSKVQIFLSEIETISNIKFKLVSIPFERASIKLLEGSIDGDIGRSKYVYGDDPRVIYATYPISAVKFIIYTKNKTLNPGNINLLRELKLVVIRGNTIIENWIKDNNIYNIVYAKDVFNTFKLIAANRADYHIGPLAYQNYLKNNIEFSDIKGIEKPIINDPAFIVLNIKHKDIEPLLSLAIKELAASGRTAEIFSVK